MLSDWLGEGGLRKQKCSLRTNQYSGNPTGGGEEPASAQLTATQKKKSTFVGLISVSGFLHRIVETTIEEALGRVP